MRYKHIVEGVYIKRPNRFIAHVQIDGREEVCHVKNTGRCKELLVPGVKVWLEKSDNPERKTAYDVIAVEKGDRVINMDSQLPNAVAYEWIANQKERLGIAELKREVTFGNSRFDLWGKLNNGQEFFVEVKGVTLESDGIVRFPDAPTERGIKHLEELIKCKTDGYGAALLFVIQMSDVKWFEPNVETHAQFGETLKKAHNAGVIIKAFDCMVKPDEMYMQKEVEVRLGL
ncbi:MAG: DNA/RNA nuclease SfsA [Lachnospiraceae bacterium]|nr:DNA/RNA nuclease SfsA [Lachnospiraceae bacterium]